MPELPAPIRRLNELLTTADVTHGYVYARYRELIELDAVDGLVTEFLRDSASIAIVQTPALLRECNEAAGRWDDELILDPEGAAATLQEIDKAIAALEPELATLHGRHVEIARQMAARVERASR